MTPRLSVCIPAYNAEPFLAEAIRSVLTQDFDEFELVIADNASTDGTRHVAESFRDERIRYFRNAVNIGAPANGNRCLELATAPYIKFLCSDDVFLPGLLKKQVALLDAYPAIGLATCDMYVTDERLGNRRLAKFTQGCCEGQAVVYRSLNAIQNFIGGPSNIMIRRSAIGALLVGEDYHWVGDLAFYCHILRGSRYGNIDEPGILYRRHPQAASHMETSAAGKALEEFELIRELDAFTQVNAFKLLRRRIPLRCKAIVMRWLALNGWRMSLLGDSLREYRECCRSAIP